MKPLFTVMMRDATDFRSPGRASRYHAVRYPQNSVCPVAACSLVALTDFTECDMALDDPMMCKKCAKIAAREAVS